MHFPMDWSSPWWWGFRFAKSYLPDHLYWRFDPRRTPPALSSPNVLIGSGASSSIFGRAGYPNIPNWLESLCFQIVCQIIEFLDLTTKCHIVLMLLVILMEKVNAAMMTEYHIVMDLTSPWVTLRLMFIRPSPKCHVILKMEDIFLHNTIVPYKEVPIPLRITHCAHISCDSVHHII